MDGTPARLGLNPVETEVYNNMIARERITFNALPDDNARIGYVRALVDRDRTWRERSVFFISHMGFGDAYANPSSFLSICRGINGMTKCTLAMKHLPEDILREELDISSIKSNEAIPDYGPCMECDIPILTEDPPKSLVLNVCVDYDGREKSSISESERPSLVNLKNLGYNILKSLDDETVGDIDFPSCGNDILMSPLKAFSYLTCGHIFHRLYRKKTFSRHSDQADALGIISNPPIPDPRKTSQSSGISPLSNLMGTFALSSPPIRMGGIEGTATQQVKSTLSIPFTS
ncbi:hypothetical protein RhiirA5_495341 [Rhizophagus irregularis]|uniref:Uncharacterized protein n=1 Tax=Rhizophagus irregularis TaxID=588596 RepID=A0A2N0Q5W4_9GLOM|nr:hypothetical protein RhiirA5_495341 [Rhizophagus irregularis]